jgi:DNA-binding GntR family transcriptional regulator
MKELSATMIGTVENRLLFESVADVLKSAILRGNFLPGERLNEVAVAKVLNISRGPVREALRQLEQEGIVDLYPQRGGRVAEVSKREVLAALAIRELLETMAAEETCEAITDENIARLRELVTEMKKAEEADDFAYLVSLDYQFHRELLTIASTDSALRTWTLLGGKLMLFQAIGNRAYLESYAVSTSHTPIIDAVEARNSQLFRKAILAHIEENRSSIQRL